MTKQSLQVESGNSATDFLNRNILILDKEKAKTVFFVKRSLNAGYSGADNPLFYADNTVMLGATKAVAEEVVEALGQE